MSNTIAVTCPRCQRDLEVRPNYSGDPVLCEHCQHSFHPKVTIPCPQCRRSLQVRREYLGKRIFCSYCKYTFKAALEGAGDLPPTAPQWAVPGPIQTLGDASKVKLLEEELEKLRADLSSRTTEHATAMLSLQQTRGLVQLLESQVRNLQPYQGQANQNAALGQELAGLRAECQQLRTQLQAAQQRAGDRDCLEQELRSAQENLTQLSQELDDLRNCPALPEESAELDLMRGDCDRLRAEVDTLRTELATRVADSEVMARVQVECNVLREERETLRNRQQELELDRQARAAAAEQLNARMQELGNALTETRAAGASLQARLEQEQESQRAERDHLLAQGQTQRQELDQLRGRVAELEQSLAQAASGHEALQIDWQRELAESRARIEAERQANLAEIEQTRGRVADLDSTLAKVRADSAEEISRLTSEAQSLRGERDQLRAREQALAQEADWLRQQIQDMQQMPTGPDGELVLSADALTRAVEEARDQWGQGANRASWQQEQQARTQETEQRYRDEVNRLETERRQLEQQLESARQESDQERLNLRNEIDRLREELAARRAEREAEGQTRNEAQLRQEATTLRVERDSALSKAAALAEERDRLAAECASARAAATDNGVAPPQRYLELAEQVRTLRAQLERGASAARGEKSSGWLGKMFGGASEPEEIPLGRRLDTLRAEAMAEREKLLLAEAEVGRAELETQLAEMRVQLQEAQTRAGRLEMEMIQNQSSKRYQPGARYDAAHESPYPGPSAGTGAAGSSQWRLDELT